MFPSNHSGLTQKQKHKLKILQNKTVRFILNLGPREHVGLNELKICGLLSIESRVNQLKLNHVFKIFNNICPSYLSKHFTRVSDVHQFFTRNSMYNFVIPKIQGTCIASNTFYYTAIKEWNKLPSHIQCLDTKDSFKRSVKSFLHETS